MQIAIDSARSVSQMSISYSITCICPPLSCGDARVDSVSFARCLSVVPGRPVRSPFSMEEDFAENVCQQLVDILRILRESRILPEFALVNLKTRTYRERKSVPTHGQVVSGRVVIWGFVDRPFTLLYPFGSFFLKIWKRVAISLRARLFLSSFEQIVQRVFGAPSMLAPVCFTTSTHVIGLERCGAQWRRPRISCLWCRSSMLLCRAHLRQLLEQTVDIPVTLALLQGFSPPGQRSTALPVVGGGLQVLRPGRGSAARSSSSQPSQPGRRSKKEK